MEEITITKEEYKELIKCACIMDIVKDYVAKNKFVSPTELKRLLGMEIAEDEI